MTKSPIRGGLWRLAGFSLSILIGSSLVLLSHPQVRSDSQNPPTAANATSSREITVSVLQQPNPLLMVAAQISKQLRIAVSYEEPAWRSDAELMRLVDAPEMRTRAPEFIARLDPGLKAALPGTVETKTYLQPGQDEGQLAGQLLQESLDDHARRGNPGKFKLVRLEDYGYSIVPTHVRGITGELVSVSSPLDVLISFPKQERSLGLTLVAIAEEVSRKYGESLEADIFNLPGINTIFDVANVNIGADKEVARDVLMRTLQGMKLYDRSEPGPVMTWQMIRRVNKTRGFADYALRFGIVMVPAAQGGTEPLYWPKKAAQ